MSKSNNVNPDHYKVAGRERQSDKTLQDQAREALRSEQAHLDEKRSRNFIPGAAPAGSKGEKR